jgi:integrase/recombinase XerD
MLNPNYKAIHTEYVLWLNTLGFSEGTVNSYRKHTNSFFEWLQIQGINHIKELTQKRVEQYFDHQQTRPNKYTQTGTLGVSQLNHSFAAIDKLLEFLHQMGSEQAPSPTGYRMRVDKQERINKIKPFKPSEIKSLQTNINGTYSHLSFTEREAKHEQLKLLFALYYGCGLRRMEGYRLTLNDIDFDRKTVFVEKGKGYKDRIIPMSKGVYSTLQEYVYNFRHKQRARHKRLFIDPIQTVADSLKELQNQNESQAIKNKRLTLHILRHSIATHLLQNGMSIENIALFLGHSSLVSTQIYTHVANQE